MDPHHRKIDLQSPADFAYLLKNIKAAAQEKIDLAIPPSAAPAGEDAYRTKVEELVQQYITTTLTLALPSLTLNGFDAPSSLLRPASNTSLNNSDNNNTNTISNTSTTTNNVSDAEIASGNYEAYDPRLAERLRNL
ncbi:MAG: hypothetical protein Q9164_005491, partial [Protoblastenia rupestris]